MLETIKKHYNQMGFKERFAVAFLVTAIIGILSILPTNVLIFLGAALFFVGVIISLCSCILILLNYFERHF